jgi:hypothetical protein
MLGDRGPTARLPEDLEALSTSGLSSSDSKHYLVIEVGSAPIHKVSTPN